MQASQQFAGQNMPQNSMPAGSGQVGPKTNPNSTQNTLMISEIRDGIVIMNDGTFRSVVMCKSINFDLMSTQEQESVEYAFQGFINSLYYPVQIFIRSQKVDLRPYIQRLDKIRSEHQNMLLAMLMEDYIDFISDISYQANIMDKTFYLVIPYPTASDSGAIRKSGLNVFAGLFGNKEQHVVINEADLEKAKTELRNMTQSAINSLSQAGIQSIPLDTQELIELYYDVYNPDTATRQPLKNFDDVSTPVVVRGGASLPPVQGGAV
jgi:type IV secretory pathway VirB4 component